MTLLQQIKIIECSRDAMQGIKTFIPTQVKLDYINQLLKVGFDTLDCGSFVSPKAIPQMRDTGEIIRHLDLSDTKTKLSVIVANSRGANDACALESIDFLGYPFSISETFQLRNTNATLEDSMERVQRIQDIALKHDKKLLIYISMAFGNPYGDPWNVEICQKWVDQLVDIGVKYFALSDTIGVGTPQSISYLFGHLIPHYTDVEFGAHLHTLPYNWREKIEAAYKKGCRKFDAAIRGYGGCPMAKDDLTGNMPTENVISYLNELDIEHEINEIEFNKAVGQALNVFPTH